MTHSQPDVCVDLCRVLVESYAVNERMNQIVLESLDPAAWRAQLPGGRAVRSPPSLRTSTMSVANGCGYPRPISRSQPRSTARIRRRSRLAPR